MEVKVKGVKECLLVLMRSKLYLWKEGTWVWNQAHLGLEDALLKPCCFDTER